MNEVKIWNSAKLYNPQILILMLSDPLTENSFEAAIQVILP